MSNPMQADVLMAADVGKMYQLYDTPRERFKALITGRGRSRDHWALQGVSLHLKRGQCLGVVGDNGAGKSTLLKLLAGTLQPSHGHLKIEGRVTAILELGAGFHPDFTGRENLHFGGSLIGLSEEELVRIEPAIIAFSELGEAIDRPVKTYSSGMVVRLAFSLVTAVEPDVLIIDEALSVGDQHFQKKCIERIDSFKQSGCTILFCSHSLYHVRHICDSTLWLDAGGVRALGPTDAVLAEYELHVRKQETEGAGKPAPQMPVQASPLPLSHHLPTGKAAIAQVQVHDLDSSTPPQLQAKDLRITMTAVGQGDECPSMGLMLEQASGVGITSLATHAEGVRPVRQPDGLWQITLVFPDLPLHSGEYTLSAYLFDERGLVIYEEWPDCERFKFLYPSLTPGLVRLPHYWK